MWKAEFHYYTASVWYLAVIRTMSTLCPKHIYTEWRVKTGPLSYSAYNFRNIYLIATKFGTKKRYFILSAILIVSNKLCINAS